MAEVKKPRLTQDAMRVIFMRWMFNDFPYVNVKFPYNIRVLVSSDQDVRIPILVDPNKMTVRLISPDHLSTLISSAAKLLREKEILFFQERYSLNSLATLNLSAKQIADISKTWFFSSDADMRADVKSFVFKSDDHFAFARSDFDLLNEYQPCPTWDTLLSNFSNVKSIMGYLGSLAFPESYRQQYLWIYGKGGDGKGALVRGVKDIFGRAFRSEQVPQKDDKYWTYGLIGMRLVVFPECENYAFPKSGLFKTLTGGDKVRVEQKFKDPFDVDLECKFLFTSNELPKISSDRSDQRRIILSKSLADKEYDWNPDFEPRLKAECGAFYSNCVLTYKEMCPTHGPVPVDKSESLWLAELYDEEFAAFVDNYFDVGKDFLCPAFVVHNLVNRFASQMPKNHFYKYLDRLGIKRNERFTYEGKQVRGFVGIKNRVAMLDGYRS